MGAFSLIVVINLLNRFSYNVIFFFIMATCAICLSEFRASSEGHIVALACGHVFDQECLESWYSQSNQDAHQNKRCPTCRKVSCVASRRILYMQFESGDATRVVENASDAQVPRSVLPPIVPGNDSINNDRDFQIGFLQAQLESAQSALTEAVNVQNNFESLNNDLKSQIDAVKGERDQMRASLVEVNNRLSVATREIECLKLTSISHEAKIRELEKILKDEKKQSELLRRSTVVIKAENQSLKKENDALRAQEDQSSNDSHDSSSNCIVLESDESSRDSSVSISSPLAVNKPARKTVIGETAASRRQTVVGTGSSGINLKRVHEENLVNTRAHRQGMNIGAMNEIGGIGASMNLRTRSTQDAIKPKPVLRSNSIQNKN